MFGIVQTHTYIHKMIKSHKKTRAAKTKRVTSSHTHPHTHIQRHLHSVCAKRHSIIIHFSSNNWPLSRMGKPITSIGKTKRKIEREREKERALAN